MRYTPTMTTKPEDCNCPDRLSAEGDDDRTLRLLRDAVIPALTPQKFVVTIEVHAFADYTTVKALIDQYRSIKDMPLSKATLEDIESELRDIASAVENLSNLVCEDITSIFEEDDAFYPALNNARMLGIQIERSTVVTDS
jgi:N-glycosylase/DNA lyase